MTLGKQDRALIAFVTNLIAIVMLSKIGGTGGDLAVMTGLIGVAGMLAQRMGEEPKRDGASGTVEDPMHTEIINKPDEPVPTTRGKK